MTINSWSISPTELSTARCETRYAFKYVLKLDRGEYDSESTAFGDEVHAIMEAWTRDGTPPNRETQAGKVAIALAEYAPHPHTGKAEGKFKFTLNGIQYGGKYDHSGLAAELADAPQHIPFLPAITDYKTSTDPEQYGLWGKAAFLDDFAAVLYAAERLQRAPAEQILVRWLYAKLSKSKVKAPGQDDITIDMGAKMLTKFSLNKWGAKPSDAVLTYAEVEQAYLTKVEPAARRVLKLRLVDSEEKALRLDKAGLKLCTEYRGCPHQHRCARVLSQGQRIEAGFRADLIGDISMALAPGLLSALNTTSLGAPAAPAAPAVAPVAATGLKFGGFKGANPPEVSTPAAIHASDVKVFETVPAPTFAAAPELAPVTPSAVAADVAELGSPCAAEVNPYDTTPLAAAPIKGGDLLYVTNAEGASDADLGRAVRTVMLAWAKACQ